MHLLKRIVGLPRHILATVLAPIRSGNRLILWPSINQRFGNQMFRCYWAFLLQRSGTEAYVLRHPQEHDVLAILPTVTTRLMIDRTGARFNDRRSNPWKNEIEDWDSLELFVNEFVSRDVQSQPKPDIGENTMVVNVRRGDYYSVPEYQRTYGYNIPEYVEAAMNRSCERSGAPKRILVVSDNSDWCEQNLGPLLSRYATVSFQPTGNAVLDFLSIIHAQRLILPNSTFSMWGGYIGDSLYPGREVIAPLFHSRGVIGGALVPHRSGFWHPGWTVIQDIPGGWEATS